jgi:hypothetical protein
MAILRQQSDRVHDVHDALRKYKPMTSVDEKLSAKPPTCSIIVALNQGQHPLRKCDPRFEDLRNFVGVHLEQE